MAGCLVTVGLTSTQNSPDPASKHAKRPAFWQSSRLMPLILDMCDRQLPRVPFIKFVHNRVWSIQTN